MGDRDKEKSATQWILPTAIPFGDLKARDLEECVYWLFDALGAKDLEWRTGGSGGGAADGGRDLEATFFVPAPDGEMEAEWTCLRKVESDYLIFDRISLYDDHEEEGYRAPCQLHA